MWMNLYNFTHNSLGMHFWELPALLTGVIVLAELGVHSYRQKKRGKKYEEEREKKLETIRQEVTGEPVTSR